MNIFKNNAVSTLMQGLIDKVVSPEGAKEPKVKNYPTMVTSPVEEIILHNSSVGTRQVKRSKKRLEDKLTRG